MRGPLVIYDPNDPQKDLYDVDDESTVITLADWYHFPSPQAPNIGMPPALALLDVTDLDAGTVFFNSTLINGLGRYKDLVGSDLNSELAVINVEKGTRYRMRMVSISCDPVRASRLLFFIASD